MKAVVFTLGCKVNEVESATIMQGLEDMGIEVSDQLSPADLYILNTCAVTNEAERKSRQLIARAKKFSPDAKIYVVGCAAQKNRQSFLDKGVAFVGSTGNKNVVLYEVAKHFHLQVPSWGVLMPKQIKTRAFIKIEDGCNNFCSYCVIPYMRGRVTSRPLQELVCECQNTQSEELVLTGINISAYQEGENNLCHLIQSLQSIPKRIRLGSLECRIITKEFLLCLKGLYDFAPQFHLSLQSGANAVLKKMNRHYTREEYIEKCKLIYSIFPDASITTDIIVGFCDEREEDFADSLSIIDEVGFLKVHAFAYSPREGTASYQWKDIDGNIKQERLHRLIEKSKEAEQRYITKQLQREHVVLCEEFDGTYTTGYTGNYIKVYLLGKHSGFQKVRLTACYEEGAIGERIS